MPFPHQEILKTAMRLLGCRFNHPAGNASSQIVFASLPEDQEKTHLEGALAFFRAYEGFNFREISQHRLNHDMYAFFWRAGEKGRDWLELNNRDIAYFSDHLETCQAFFEGMQKRGIAKIILPNDWKSGAMRGGVFDASAIRVSAVVKKLKAARGELSYAARGFTKIFPPTVQAPAVN